MKMQKMVVVLKTSTSFPSHSFAHDLILNFVPSSHNPSALSARRRNPFLIRQ
jgi:hypothetical protein